jgi:hypothetical protein
MVNTGQMTAPFVRNPDIKIIKTTRLTYLCGKLIARGGTGENLSSQGQRLAPGRHSTSQAPPSLTRRPQNARLKIGSHDHSRNIATQGNVFGDISTVLRGGVKNADELRQLLSAVELGSPTSHARARLLNVGAGSRISSATRATLSSAGFLSRKTSEIRRWPADDAGNAAAARGRLIVWRKHCQHQVEPDPAEMVARYRRNDRTRLARAAGLLQCGSREIDMVVTGTEGR